MKPTALGEIAEPKRGAGSRARLVDKDLNAVIRRMNADSPKWVDPARFQVDLQRLGDRANRFTDSLVEFAMAHALDDDTEAAHRRGDMLERRRKLMEAWAAYCEPAERKS